MTPEYSRRDFLKISAVTVAGLAVFGPREVLAQQEHITFEDVRDVAYMFDRLRNRLPELDIPINQETMDAWINEVVPWFEEIGVIDTAVKPSKPVFVSNVDAESSFHLIGASTCGNNLEMNSRLQHDSLSSWKDNRMFFGGVVHEVAHAQQGDLCFSLGRYDQDGLESSAQVGMIGVLSAMTIDGNVIALHSFIEEMWYMSIWAAVYLALRDDRWSDFKAIAEHIYTTPLQRAKLERFKNMLREKNPREIRELQRSLYRYNYLPLETLIFAHRNDADNVSGLIFPNPDIALADFGYLMRGDNLKQITYEQIYGSK